MELQHPRPPEPPVKVPPNEDIDPLDDPTALWRIWLTR